jgi:hypothetical protein
MTTFAFVFPSHFSPLHRRERCLRDDFRPLHLQNPWKKGRLFVRQIRKPSFTKIRLYCCRAHWIRKRIRIRIQFRIQHFKWIRIRIRGFDDYISFDQKSKVQEKPSAVKKEHPAFQKMKFINFFLCLWIIFAFLDPVPDPETDPGTLVNTASVRIRIHNTGSTFTAY